MTQHPKHPWMSVIAAGVFVMGLAAPAVAKQLPPAFGTELVPEQSTQPRNDPKPAADEDLEESTEEKPKRAVRRPPPRVGRDRRIRIQLDGDEDGGGDDLLDDEF